MAKTKNYKVRNIQMLLDHALPEEKIGLGLLEYFWGQSPNGKEEFSVAARCFGLWPPEFSVYDLKRGILALLGGKTPKEAGLCPGACLAHMVFYRYLNHSYPSYKVDTYTAWQMFFRSHMLRDPSSEPSLAKEKIKP